MSDERRIHPRHETRVSARLTHEDRDAEGVLENVGSGGVFFVTEDLELLVDDGADVTVTFQARRGDTEEEVHCPGQVLRSDRYFDGTHVVRAFAIKFKDLIPLEGLTFGE